MTTRVSSCPFPSNITPLIPQYKFSIQKIPELTYMLQEVTLPSVSLDSIDQRSSLASIPLPGDQMTFDSLQVDFLVDNVMANYVAVFNWIQGLGFPESHKQYQDYIDKYSGTESAKAYSDGTLTIMDGLGNPVREIQFVDLVPISLEGLTFTNTQQDVQYMVGRATFRYTLYKFL